MKNWIEENTLVVSAMTLFPAILIVVTFVLSQIDANWAANADPSYYSTVAQMLPFLLVAAFLELGVASRRRFERVDNFDALLKRLTDSGMDIEESRKKIIGQMRDQVEADHQTGTQVLAAVTVITAVGEAAALWALAAGKTTPTLLGMTAITVLVVFATVAASVWQRYETQVNP